MVILGVEVCKEETKPIPWKGRAFVADLLRRMKDKGKSTQKAGKAEMLRVIGPIHATLDVVTELSCHDRK